MHDEELVTQGVFAMLVVHCGKSSVAPGDAVGFSGWSGSAVANRVPEGQGGLALMSILRINLTASGLGPERCCG